MTTGRRLSGGWIKKSEVRLAKEDTRFTPIAPCDTADAVGRLCMAYEQAIVSEKVDSLFCVSILLMTEMGERVHCLLHQI